ncbi:unnamed protein product [Rhizophagus irregularis]|nr:unnamed protein product [Rhizophagus irregularis]
MSYVNMQNKAVFCGNGYGPAMGNLYCNDNDWSYRNSNNENRYPKIGIPAKFEVEDYEVFQQDCCSI